MARIRTIKPTHVSDKKLSEISLQAHLLWVLSWCFSDDEGIFENDPLLIKSQLFPRRTDIRVEQVQLWLDQLVTARFIIPFTHEGEGYYIHRTFKTHQKIDRPQPSKIPFETIKRVFSECSSNVQPCIVLESIVLESRGEEPPPKKNGTNFPTVETAEKLSEIEIQSCIQYVSILKKMDLTPDAVAKKFEAFKIQHFTGQKFYQDHSAIVEHFRDWLKFQKEEKNGSIKNTFGKIRIAANTVYDGKI